MSNPPPPQPDTLVHPAESPPAYPAQVQPAYLAQAQPAYPVQFQPGYPAQAPLYYQVPAPRTNGLAVTALVTALLGILVVPVICGHIGLRQIRARGEAGETLAIVGLVLGYLELGVIAAFFVIAIAVGAIALPASLY